ncbi:hypothetical protein IHV82_03970 [Mycobacterium avium]|nr:hypothetical protein IHV82_03970 [Mycobacterium avium]
MINALRWLAAAAFDALAHIAYPAADAIWEERRRRPDAELILLDEMADHLGVIRAQLEDIRNLLLARQPPPCNCNSTVPGFHTFDCPASPYPQPDK